MKDTAETTKLWYPLFIKINLNLTCVSSRVSGIHQHFQRAWRRTGTRRGSEGDHVGQRRRGGDQGRVPGVRKVFRVL